jgi:lysophospholipase L1-like esterase
VSWRAVARSGATSRTARELVLHLASGDWLPDVVVVLIGVNDLKNLRPLRQWDQDVMALLMAIGETTGGVPVIVSGMAPVSRWRCGPGPWTTPRAARQETVTCR